MLFAYLLTYYPKYNPGYDRIESELRIGRKTIYKAIIELKRANLITATDRRLGQNTQLKPVGIEEGENFIQLPSWFIRSHFSLAFKGVYALLLSYQGTNDHAWPKFKEMETALGISPGTLVKVLRELQCERIVKSVESKLGFPNRYVVVNLVQEFIQDARAS
jgi:DNA-binding transcriptional regulator YhcF (GntR family)